MTLMTDSLTCEYTIDGNADGPSLVFIHGWPDNASLWRKQVEALGPDYRCVLMTLPNYGEEPVKAGGFDFPAVTEMLAATLEQVRRGDERFTLITHDWGAYCGYHLEKTHPGLIAKMVALDIGGHLEPPNAKAKLFIMGYQWTLIGCWMTGGVIPPLGNALTRAFAGLLKVPERQRANIRSRYNYMYFYLWRAMLLPGWKDSALGRYQPQCPVLYLYGTRKPFMFHSSRWLDMVDESGGRSEGLEAGHWLMEAQADQVNQLIRDWLENTA